MSATIIAFPIAAARPPAACLADFADPVTITATALATKFTDHFLPICQASIDLLEADEREFEDRCRRMLDADGVVLIEELCAELETVGEQMQVLVDGLELTRVRLRTAMARLATDGGERLPESAS